jgi:flagellar hook-length control protein FliK
VEKKGCDDTPACDDLLNDIQSLIDKDRAALNDETQLVADLNQLIALLEELGLKASSGETMSLPGPEGAEKNISSPADRVLDRLAALKQLLGIIQSNGQNPGNETMTGLERLRQLIAQAMAADNSAHNQSETLDGLNSNQLLDPGQANIGINGTTAAEGTGAEKPVEIHPELSQVAVGGDSVSKDPSLTKPLENSQVPGQSESGEKRATLKPQSDMQAAPESKGAAKDAKGPELVPGEAGDSSRVGDHSRLPAAADKGSRSGGEPPLENSLTGESSPVSKLINDVQTEKDTPLKGDIGPGDEAGSKVVKTEAGTNDSGQLTSQSQPFDKTLESASGPKEAEAAQREFRNQTMEQIVRRAVIQVRDGQHEARIDLKPEFMGHLRMQVITENQQVTVKILTEFGFVKDMIENSVQQLKADLQQQGLEVDKVDVSVSRDSQGHKHGQESAEHAKSLRREDTSSDPDNHREGQPERPDRSPLRVDGLSTVDFFA